ncbi:MAG: diaminopimelate dehydrogenase [Corallococcus sp.]|nr:diaminopimelate dehydrogenase [Corallococcus sp.]MCM1359122.1 diaminopimelate dehydrogenase [Corallococcus sp.]MCM1394512.1 diaminopimelate dehydrogenase [Corallococcus sp.]
MNIAIAGYGNLGKSLEKIAAETSDMRLAAVFSRRDIQHTLATKFDDAKKFAGKIDVVLLAMGSFDDIERNVKYFSAFDTVDSFDTHAETDRYKTRLNQVKPDTVSLCCVGWDPGVLSLIRGALTAAGGTATTFWGRGISQGHSNALRQIRGVYDAVEITVPKNDAVLQARHGKEIPENLRHCRLCYVACEKGSENKIAQQIVNMPNYFCGQEVKIEFCSQSKVSELKKSTDHGGDVITVGNGYFAETRLTLESNTDYTARIMLTYAKAIASLRRDGYRGALTPFDIPMKYVASERLI